MYSGAFIVFANLASFYDFHRAVCDGFNLRALTRLTVDERRPAHNCSNTPFVSIELANLHRRAYEHLCVKREQKLVEKCEEQGV
jgi:hypothetical protein